MCGLSMQALQVSLKDTASRFWYQLLSSAAGDAVAPGMAGVPDHPATLTQQGHPTATHLTRGVRVIVIPVSSTHANSVERYL